MGLCRRHNNPYFWRALCCTLQ
uniref:Uncharacterized protein n=1 Tax=Anguilla anguilla TaxID=7936 RepID=A0A0E9RQW6_ANGAN